MLSLPSMDKHALLKQAAGGEAAPPRPPRQEGVLCITFVLFGFTQLDIKESLLHPV